MAPSFLSYQASLCCYCAVVVVVCVVVCYCIFVCSIVCFFAALVEGSWAMMYIIFATLFVGFGALLYINFGFLFTHLSEKFSIVLISMKLVLFIKKKNLGTS